MCRLSLNTSFGQEVHFATTLLQQNCSLAFFQLICWKNFLCHLANLSGCSHIYSNSIFRISIASPVSSVLQLKGFCVYVITLAEACSIGLFVSRTTYRWSDFTLSIITKSRNYRTLWKPAIAGSSLWYRRVFYEENFCPRLLIVSRFFNTPLMFCRWSVSKVSCLPLAAPLTVTPSIACQDAIAIMQKEGFDQLPVVDQHRY